MISPKNGCPSRLTGPLRQLQLSRLQHRTGRRYPGSRGRLSPPRRDRECGPRPRIKCGAGSEVRRGAQSPALGPLPRQRWLAGRPGHGPQSGPLDWAHRPGRAGGNHQDLPAAPSSPWPAASPCAFLRAGPGKTSSVAPRSDCAPCRSPPDDTHGL